MRASGSGERKLKRIWLAEDMVVGRKEANDSPENNGGALEES